jgi:hypothetical protein
MREAEREEKAVTVSRDKITADMCAPISHEKSILEKVIVIRPDVLRPEYQTADNQLAYVIGGFGLMQKRVGMPYL